MPDAGGAEGLHPASQSLRKHVWNSLRRREKGSAKAVAERLGTSRRTVKRYLAGKLTPRRSATRPPCRRKRNPSDNRRSERRHANRPRMAERHWPTMAPASPPAVRQR
ncbi:helix-turn-helix domain-containing protein [Streptomyces sp. ICN988]|uniref:helix-turn-helix domain-containing protein n=1 Tax=Streptomyces sp. ICN988 TaxID=2983765 RepID=UPI00398D4283